MLPSLSSSTKLAAVPEAPQEHPDVEYIALSSDSDIAPVVANNSIMGLDEQFSKPEGRNGDNAAGVTAYASVGVFLVSTWVILFANDPSSLGWYFWHPLLNSAAIPTSQPRTKAAGLARHQLSMLIIGFPLIFMGTFAIFYNKILHNGNHFVTWHASFGLLCIVWIVAQIIIGGGSVWFQGRLFGGFPNAKLLWKYHRISGYLLFPIMLFTAYLAGAWSSWTTSHVPLVVRLVAFIIAPAVLAISIFSRLRPSKLGIM
ncbi:hypothetical protein OBBRIDRAFT_830842 [Obba rivulosa]|uniref:Cytochrome b561 domain-containing protein n=1 Tax=Obba rivulosa TaxID=1052685 RepID=A0A8E2DTJ4_9APHY|nr:hypothetical protein OBBRIDRAFT_830842 [Obba rivulosa]